MKYYQPVTSKSAKGLVEEVYKQIKRDFGPLAEPFTLHSPFPELLAGVWMACRETELVGTVPRELKEVVALTVSEINQCSYCVDAHTIMLRASGNRQAVASIKTKTKRLDNRVKSIIAWAKASRSPNSSILLSPPFSKSESPEIIGTAVFYHYINRMVTVLVENSTPLPSRNQRLKSIMISLAGYFFSKTVQRPKTAGKSLTFLPKAMLPDDLQWAKGSPTIAEAYAGFAMAVDRCRTSLLSKRVRNCILKCIESWDGEDPGISRRWSEQFTSGLKDQSHVEAQLALLTAIAPYQVDEEVVENYLIYHPDPKDLLCILAWSSFMVARRIGHWLSMPFFK
jgi:AhpD family alkylhydroperoxidase